MARPLITAVDTNILLDLLIANAPHANSSEAALSMASRDGGVVVSEPVLAEMSGLAGSFFDPDRFMSRLRATFVPSGVPTLRHAGEVWRAYTLRRKPGLACADCGARQTPMCARCGVALSSRQHLVADFIIGAHAEAHADALLTRDRGYYRTYFPKLKLV